VAGASDANGSGTLRQASALLLIALAAVSSDVQGQERVVRLDTLVVVGSRVTPGLSAQVRAIDVVDRAQLQRLPVRSVADALQWVLGVDVMARSPAQADLSIRGSGAEQVLVLIDGIPANDRQTAHFNLDVAIPLDRVERIEVLRGPASAAYGTDAMGGVVNVVTRSPGGRADARVEGGTWDTFTGSLGAGLRIGALRVGSGAALGRSDGHRDGTDYRTADVHVAAEAPLGGGTIAARVGHRWNDFGATGFYAPYPSYEETRTATAGASWSGSLSRRLTLEPGVYWRRHRDHFVLDREDPDFYRNRHTSSHFGAEAVARYRGGRGMRFAVGTIVGRDVIESSNLGDHTEDRWALFVETVLQRGPLSASLGARGDHYEGYGFVASPTVALAYGARAVRVRGSLGRSFRGPSWTERYYQDPQNIGDPDLRPETAWAADVGLDVALAGEVWLSATAFGRSARDLIDWSRSEGSDAPWETRNIESATFRGIEIELSAARMAGLRLRATGTVLSVSADSTDGFVSKYALRPIVEDVRVGLGRSVGSLEAETRVSYRRREGESGYLLWDLRLGLRVRRGEVYVDLLNGLDAAYDDVVGARAAGRAVLVGFRIGG